MDGPQDLGGKTNFGPINPENDEPVFHDEWEKKVLALTLAAGGLGHWSLDEGRHARESLTPVEYYTFSYYEIWFAALKTLLVRHGEVTTEEIARSEIMQPGIRTNKRVSRDTMLQNLAKGGPSERLSKTDALYKVGDRVRTIQAHPVGHTRLPNYARNKVGVIESLRGTHVYPDSNAHGKGEQPQWLYTVAFTGDALWGADTEIGLSVSVDAWESYLEHT